MPLLLIFVSVIKIILAMRKIETQIIINASIENVWQILTDFDRYPEWNPFIKTIEGDLIVDNPLMVVLESMKMKPVITFVKWGVGFSWKGHLLFRGIFDGEHSFRLKSNSNGTITFLHSEVFTGVLVPFCGALLASTKQNFIAMNEALKNLVESGE